MTVPEPRRVVPVVADIGEQHGHRLVLLSLEVYDTWTDLRFARIDVGAPAPLPRRVPPAEAWSVSDDLGTDYTIVDAVGRGDRAFSNGEVRVVPAVPDSVGALEITVRLTRNGPPLQARIAVS